jgi:hypothetical protein
VTFSTHQPLQVWCGLLKIAPDQFPASTVLPRMLPFPVMDTSTGSLESRDAPPRLCTRNQSSVQPNQTGFTYRWLHAWMQFFSVQHPTHCHGSKHFPKVALFTTLLRRVRLSQSAGCKTKYVLSQLHAILNGLSQPHRGASTHAGGPCIPPP